MGKFIDMTGWVMKEHGVIDSELIVIKRGEKSSDGHIKWICKCKCGEEISVVGKDIRSGHTKRCTKCGKKSSGQKRIVDITNEHFGRLTALHPTENRSGRNVIWLCQCECGNTCEVSSNSLKTGNAKSCGCLQKEKTGEATRKDISNQNFGLLTALYPLEERTKNQAVIWHCACNCGNFIDVPITQLTTGNTKSCGCLNMSNGEFKIKQLLEENNIKFIQEYCPNVKDLFKRARYDFYIPSLNLLIEFDGKQHFEPIKYWGGEEEFKIRQAHDKEKTQWALNHGISIIRIPYTHYNNLCIKDLMPETSNFILHKKIKYISRQH